MKCAYCKYNDGLVYTSIPPKYRCIITDEFHLGLDDCDVEFTPVRHGRWVNDNGLYKCSVCNTFTITGWANCIPIDQMNKTMRYCNNCGAKMDLEE